jgi:hypothetical protein
LASVFGVPVSMISAAYEATGVTPAPAPAVEPATIERLNHHQTAPGSLSPAATTTISSPFLPDATYNIPGFSLPDYRYNDTSGSTGGLSSTSGGLTNYVTAVEPARSGPEGYTGPSINALPPGGGLGPNESSLGNTTLDRGIGGGGSFVDGDSSLFHQDLIHQDAKEEARDVDFLDYLARLAAQEANKPLGGTQGAYDAILEASAAIDTGGEYADELYRLNSAIDNKTKEGFGYAKQAAYGVDSLGNELTPAQIAAADLAATAALDTKNTLVDERNTLFESGVEAGIIETPGFLESLKDTGLEGLSDVLGAGTRGIYNVASNIPVVGGYLGDSIEGTADWFKNTQGSATINPITGAVSGIWGIPDWMEPGSTSSIGSIANTNVGISTGNEQLDAIIGIVTGDQDVGGETTGAATGVNQAVLDAAKAAGTTAGELIDAGTATTALTDDEIAAEKEKNLAIATQVFEDAGGGADGVQAVLDTLEENDLTIADLADLTGVSETDINAFIDTTLTPTPPTPPTVDPTPPTPTPTTITLTGGDGTTLSSDGRVMGPLTQEELDALGITPTPPTPPTVDPTPPTVDLTPPTVDSTPPTPPTVDPTPTLTVDSTPPTPPTVDPTPPTVDSTPPTPPTVDPTPPTVDSTPPTPTNCGALHHRLWTLHHLHHQLWTLHHRLWTLHHRLWTLHHLHHRL